MLRGTYGCTARGVTQACACVHGLARTAVPAGGRWLGDHVVAQVVHDDDDGQGDNQSDDQGGDKGVEHGGDHWDEQNLK